MKLYFLQDVSGPFLYGTLNRRPQMTLPRPRSDRLGSETSSITNHIDLPVMTSSISAYNNNTGMSGQDIWTPMAVHHSHPGHGAHCGGGYQMPGTVGNGGPGNGSVASSLRSESPISSGKTFTQSHYTKVAQGGVSSRAIHNCSWIFSLFLAKNIFFKSPKKVL